MDASQVLLSRICIKTREGNMCSHAGMHTHAGACAHAAEVERNSLQYFLIGIPGDGVRDVCHAAAAVAHPEVPPKIAAIRGGVDPIICLH